MTHELRALTSLRMFAALVVFVHHYSGLPYGSVEFPLQAVVVEGHIGVTLFFVLSGFLIALSYYTEIQEGRFSFRDYLIKRFARIIPLYWVVLGLTLWLTGQNLLSFDSFLNWTLLHGYYEALRFGGITTAWTLTVEVTFYLIAPLVFITCIAAARVRSPLPSLLHVVLMLLVWIVGLFLLGHLLLQIVIAGKWFYGSLMGNPYFIAIYTIFGRFAEFAIGILAALIYMRYREQILKQPPLLWTTVTVGCTLVILYLLYQMNVYGGIIFQAPTIITPGWYFNYPIAALSGVLILSLTHERSPATRLLSKEPFVYLGRVSYALYLVHMTPLVTWWLGALTPGHLGFMPLLYGVATVVSILLYEGVERPLRSLVLRLARGRRVNKEAVNVQTTA
jgi:peptidoglycan/LPS O-acetylase OafA/YrhL